MSHVLPPLFSRLLAACIALGCVAAALWMGYVLLEPVPIPPLPPGRAYVRFDTKADVSQNVVFQHLEPLGSQTFSLDGLGRLNPFAPVPIIVTATTTVSSTTTLLPVMSHESTSSVPLVLPTTDTASFIPSSS